MTHTIKHRDKTVVIKIDNPHIEGGMEKTHPFYEGKMLDWIADNIPHGGEYIDIGAYVGNHSIYFATYCTDKVVAFEPVYYPTLLENLRLNKLTEQIQCYGVGLSDSDGEMGFSDRSNGHNPAATSLVEGTGVPIKTLDEYIDTFTAVRLIKIDVEFMEWQVLQGGLRVIEKFRPHLFIEITEEKALKDIDELLGKYRYKRMQKFNATPTYYYKP